jgi:hypothetical protein
LEKNILLILHRYLPESVSNEESLIERMMSYCLQSHREEEDSKCWEVFLSLKNKWEQEVSLNKLDSTKLWQITKERLKNYHSDVFNRLDKLAQEYHSKVKAT